MRRRATSLFLVTAVAASLPGCVAVFGDVDTDDDDTPNQRALTALERRMDRVEEHLPKQSK